MDRIFMDRIVAGLGLLAQRAPKTVGGDDATNWLMVVAFWGMVLTVFVLPFVIGSLAARLLKLKDLWWKIGIVVFALFAGLTKFVWPVVDYQIQSREYQAEKAEWDSLPKTSEKISSETKDQLEEDIEDLTIVE